MVRAGYVRKIVSDKVQHLRATVKARPTAKNEEEAKRAKIFIFSVGLLLLLLMLMLSTLR